MGDRGENAPLLGGSVTAAGGAAAAATSRSNGAAHHERSRYGSAGSSGNDDDLDSTFHRKASLSSIYHVHGKGSWSVTKMPSFRTVDILQRTRRHRLYMALFLAAVLFFITIAVGFPTGWTLGHIITTSVLMPETVPCPPGTHAGAAKCTASEIVIVNTRINYGLFGRLKYATTAETSTHIQIKPETGPARTTMTKESAVVSSRHDPDYRYWGQHFPQYMGYVRATQALVAASWLATLFVFVLLGVISFARPAPRYATKGNLQMGCYALTLAAVALLLSLICWKCIPLSAFTTQCEPEAIMPGMGRADEGGLVCTQLGGDFCAGNCHVDNGVTRVGAMFGLVFFSALLATVSAVFWYWLAKEIEDAVDHPGGPRSDSPVFVMRPSVSS